ncbi:MAG: hypothetical protein ABW352_12805 [Polyangiales bacterium]
MTIPDARVRREPPSRGGPVRSPLHAARGTSEPARRTVEAAVETAYRVYEDYVRWGRESAAQRAEGRTTMGPKMLDPQSAFTQWMGIWQEMYRGWMGAFTPLTQAAPGMFGFDGMAPFQAPAAQASSFDLTVETSRRTRISLTWLRPPGGGTLRAQLMREEGEGRLALELDPSALRIEIPAQQPAGTYSGVVRDARGEQLGMLTLQLF